MGRTQLPTPPKCTFFLNAHETFSQTDHTDHKTSFSKLERIEIIESMLSDHNGMKLEINNRKLFGKITGIWK